MPVARAVSSGLRVGGYVAAFGYILTDFDGLESDYDWHYTQGRNQSDALGQQARHA